MSVSNYTPGNGCKYNYSKLKNKIYLVSEDHVKKVYIDNGEAYISGLTETPLLIEGFNIEFKEDTSLDERYKFQKTLTISKKGYASFKDFQGKYYAIIETIDGTFYMVNVDFPSKITHTFNLSKNTNQTDFTFTSISNYPTLKINYDFGANSYQCTGFNVSGIKGLKLCERIRTEISSVSGTVYTYGASSGENERSFRTIEYLGDSCTFQETYDGSKVTDTITFNIGFDAYKTSWQYNLLEFVENLYSAIIESEGEEDIRYYSGFNNGLEPNYSIVANDGNGQSDIITITLTESSNIGSFKVDEMMVVNNNSTFWRWIRKYGNHKTYECLEPGVGLYLVKEEVWANGTPTGRYMVMSGYEDEFYYLNIVGTFNDEVTFYQPECTCSNSRPKYDWETLPISEDYECDSAATKYYKVAQIVSYDCGETWEETGNYRKGDVYETGSTDCGYRERWVNMDITDGYYCDECGTQSDYYYKYFTLVAVDDCVFEMRYVNPSVLTGNNITVYYSLDNAKSWTQYINPISVSAGNKVLWKSFSFGLSNFKVGAFTTNNNGRFIAEGNAMSLMHGSDFVGNNNLNSYNGFRYLFSGSTGLVGAENMILPSTTLATGCYAGMFKGCTSLTTTPSLPATNLSGATGCYISMFSGCTSLTTAPVLSATTLAESCYEEMFEGCTSLTTAPVLPATTMEIECYRSMFEGCTSLTTAPVLSATTLAESCYQFMFSGCTSLTSVDVLPATTLAPYCYYQMFVYCTSLTTVPSNMLPATTLASCCYDGMFGVCTSLTTAPQLPATTLVYQCYCHMFSNCTSLTTVPQLPATTLAEACYAYMFYCCSSLTTAPDLLAPTAARYCYDDMFNGCTSLNYVKCLLVSSNTPAFEYWLGNVSATGTFVKHSSTNWGDCSVNTIPCGWSVNNA